MTGRGHTSGRAVGPLLFLLFAAAPAQATVLRESIEWAVADSDVVIRGRIARVTREAPAGEDGWTTVDIDVLETIKGPAADRVTVRCAVSEWQSSLSDWTPAGGDDRLMFLVNSNRRTRDTEEYARHLLAMREDGWMLVPRPRRVVALGRNNRRVLTGVYVAPSEKPALSYDLEFRPLADEAHALAAVRKAAREELPAGPEGRTKVLVEAPPGVEALRDLPEGTRFVLNAPLDARIERIARAWAGNPSSRHNALAVLTRLKSERNIELLKTYLDDPSFIRGTTAGKAATWHHDDRLSAYEALRRWGVDVPRPDIEMPADAYRPAGRPATWAAAGVALLTAGTATGLFILRRRRAARRLRRGTPGPAPGFVPSLFDGVAVTLLLLAIAAALLWRLSWRTVHEFTFSTATGRHWVSGFRGRIQWVRIAGWERHAPLSHARFDLDASPPEPWTHDGVQVTASGYRHGFSRLDGTVTYHGLTFGTPLKYAAREAPAWVPAALLAVVPLVRGVFLLGGTARRLRRRFRRQCAACGYDLRASHGRCPECGESVTVPPAAAAAERVGT